MSHILTIAPDAVATWAHDVSGNTVALATFDVAGQVSMQP
jgi:hypothetical protein